MSGFTTASDGIHEVVDDVVYAEQYGLDFIAITNHGGKANEPKIYAEYEEIVTQRVYNPNLFYLWAPEKSYSAVLDSLRNGRSFVVHGDLIDALEFSAETGGETADLGGTLSCPEGADVKVTIKVRDPQTTNNQGENPVLKQVQLISNVSGTPEITKVFKSGDWVEQDGYLVMEHTFKNVTRDFYVRVRGSNTDEINPAEDPQNEDPWQDLWFYSNPIFVKVVWARVSGRVSAGSLHGPQWRV
jgi:hypothetical protein